MTWMRRLQVVWTTIGALACLGLTSAVAAQRPSPGAEASATRTTPAAAAASSASCWSHRPAEVGFHRRMNASRSGGGRSRLRLDPELSKAARVHTREMVDEQVLHHTSASTLGRRVTRWNLLGENVGVGHTVDSLHTAFMSSPAHRANIMLTSFRYVGVGTVSRGGRLWVTVVFENRVDPGTRLNMPSC